MAGGGGVPYFSQTHFRFRKDDGSETTATWRAAEDTNVSIALDELFRLRIQIKETAGVAWPGSYFTLVYSLNSSGYYSSISDTTRVQFVASSNFADGDDCTALLTSNGTFVSDNNGMRESPSAIYNSGSASNYFECEFCLKLDSGQIDVDDTLDFRVYIGAESGPINTYAVTPRATASSGSSGIPKHFLHYAKLRSN